MIYLYDVIAVLLDSSGYKNNIKIKCRVKGHPRLVLVKCKLLSLPRALSSVTNATSTSKKLTRKKRDRTLNAGNRSTSPLKVLKPKSIGPSQTPQQHLLNAFKRISIASVQGSTLMKDLQPPVLFTNDQPPLPQVKPLEALE